MSDAARRAYATLGLPPGAAPALVKRRYRQLVRQWHPDRFASDAANQAEATERLAHFNAAYHLLTAEADSPTAPAADSRASSRPSAARSRPAAAASSPPSATGRLSREQIEAMVQSIGTEGPLDGILSWLDRISHPTPDLSAARPSPAGVAAAVLVAAVFIGLELRYGHRVADPILLAIICGVLLTSWLTKLRR
jgi:hypothetical protein